MAVVLEWFSIKGFQSVDDQSVWLRYTLFNQLHKLLLI